MKKLYTLLAIVFVGFIGNAQIVNIPDAAFKAKLLSASSTASIAYNSTGTKIKIDTNNDGNIQVSEALTVYKLEVGTSSTTGNITDMTGVESFTNLQTLTCWRNHITILNVVPLTHLTTLNCASNALTTLNVSSLTSLIYLYCSGNELTSLDTSNSPNLKTLEVYDNTLSNLNIANCNALISVRCYRNQLTSLDISNRTSLTTLDCWSNLITNLNITGCNALTELDCGDNQLTSLDVSNRPALFTLNCAANLLTSFNISNDLALNDLNFSSNQIQAINIDPFINIQSLMLGTNPYTSPVNLSTLINLNWLDAQNITSPAMFPLNSTSMPLLTSLQILKTDGSNLGNFNYALIPNLDFLLCRNTGLTSLSTIPTTITQLVTEANLLTNVDLTAFPNLTVFQSYNNPITNVVFGNHPDLYYLSLGKSQLTSLDVSGLPAVSNLSMSNCPLLTSCNIKNGLGVGTNFGFGNCPNLQYICADDGEIASIQTAIITNAASFNGNPNCQVNTYCTLEPGGTFYTIQGNNRYDSNSNGCDASDINIANLKLSFSNGTTTFNLIPDITGAYHYDVPASTQTFSAMFENPTYFTSSPATATVTFPTSASPYTQNFCVSANGVHNDLEVALLPITRARPGIDGTYRIVCKNKGTLTQSGTVSLTFNDGVMNLVSAIPINTGSSTNNLSWSLSNLQPFETREIYVRMHINSPTDTPAVNAGDVLAYTATIIGITDETPNNNSSTLNQTVVNSLDPNDKTCVEGTTITPSMVGQYVHYVIRFENDGTANAENIVVKDVIDATKFDISSLVPLSGSASYVTRITNTNQAEFIFQNINLPFTSGTNTGYVAFKIKTLPTLVVGDTFSNSANIYFDYNFPIVTNTATTTIATLATQDFDFGTYFSIYPNPAKHLLNLETKATIDVKSIAIYNLLGQMVIAIPNAESVSAIDVSDLKTGTYLIKVTTDKGTAYTKFIKE